MLYACRYQHSEATAPEGQRPAKSLVCCLACIAHPHSQRCFVLPDESSQRFLAGPLHTVYSHMMLCRVPPNCNVFCSKAIHESCTVACGHFNAPTQDTAKIHHAISLCTVGTAIHSRSQLYVLTSTLAQLALRLGSAKPS